MCCNATFQKCSDQISHLIFVSILQDAFSLLAYADPWSSPVGYQLDPLLREPVCAALNSAILGKYMPSKLNSLKAGILKR